jgi:hypothetical protein
MRKNYGLPIIIALLIGAFVCLISCNDDEASTEDEGPTVDEACQVGCEQSQDCFYGLFDDIDSCIKNCKQEAQKVLKTYSESCVQAYSSRVLCLADLDCAALKAWDEDYPDGTLCEKQQKRVNNACVNTEKKSGNSNSSGNASCNCSCTCTHCSVSVTVTCSGSNNPRCQSCAAACQSSCSGNPNCGSYQASSGSCS